MAVGQQCCFVAAHLEYEVAISAVASSNPSASLSVEKNLEGSRTTKYYEQSK